MKLKGRWYENEDLLYNEKFKLFWFVFVINIGSSNNTSDDAVCGDEDSGCSGEAGLKALNLGSSNDNFWVSHTD